MHVELDQRTETTGVIMCEQVKALDIVARSISFREKAPQDIVEEVVNIIMSFLDTKNE